MSDLSDPNANSCARHPKTETRISCAECGTPICPRCAVETPVGQKCPTCARLPKSAVRQGRPDQYSKAMAYGLGAAAVGAFVLQFLYGNVGFLHLILTGLVGYGIGRAVTEGAQGNRAPVFRKIAMGFAVLAAIGGWTLLTGDVMIVFTRSIWIFLTLPAAAYGANAAFR